MALSNTQLQERAENLRQLLNTLRLSDLRVAVVKSTTYSDLFCCVATNDASILTFSSLMRSGPVGLYVEADCTGIVIEHDPRWANHLIRQRVFDCNHGTMNLFLEQVPHSRSRDEAFAALGTQKDFGRDAASIDWSEYDLVLAMDGCVPSMVTREFPTTAWAYYIGEPCMRQYRRSSKAPLEGYQWFLNQRFRAIDTTALASHELEFPYYLQYPGCFEPLLDREGLPPRSGSTLEHHSASTAAHGVIDLLKRYGEVRLSAGTPRDIIDRLHASKYFVRLGGRRLWGNALIEAVSAGCLVVGDPSAFVHRDLFTPATSAATQLEVVDRVRALEADQELYAAELERQRLFVQFVGFDRPVADLLERTGLREIVC
ncbi:MAG: hypothetical protein ACR2LG_06080 [Actinomycetota bacterium]